MKSIQKTRDLLPRFHTAALIVLAVVLLYFPVLHDRINYDNFVAEATIILAGAAFILTAVTNRYSKDGYLLFLGYAFLINAGYELYFLLSGFQPGILASGGNGLAETLRLTGRIILNIGLVAAPFLTKKTAKLRAAVGFLIVAALLSTWVIGGRGSLPNMMAAKGWAELPKFMESAILLFLVGALSVHYLRRQQLHRSMYLTMSACIAFLILAECGSFLARESFNWMGYGGGICRILAYLVALRGIVNVSIEIPYEVIFKELKDSATLDPLTGLLNRKGLNDFIQKELAYRPEAASVGVLLMDLDGFKLVNDRYGHSTGDYLLVEFAKLLKACLRGTDVVCRLGGDEFMVLVKAGQIELNMVRQRIQDAVARWREKDKMAFQIGVSIGSSTWNLQKTRDISQLIMEADQDMYWEKRKRKLLEKSGKRPQ